MNRIRKSFVALAALLVAITCIAALPSAAVAATYALTPTAKTAFDKMTAAADLSQRNKLNAQYGDLQSVQEQDRKWDSSIAAQHASNEEAQKAVRQSIKKIDEAKLSKLASDVTRTKEHYKPLFALYKSINEKIDAAKLLKDKDLNALLRAQAEPTKIAVQLAREDIRSKEQALKNAKDAVARTAKAVRDTLSAIEPLKAQIKAQKSALDVPKKRLPLEWKDFTGKVKKSDAQGSSEALSAVVASTRQVIERKQAIHSLEKKIADVILKAKAQIPAAK